MCSNLCCFVNESPKSNVRQVIPSQKYCLEEEKLKDRTTVAYRKCTDVFFLILAIAFLIVLIGLLIYCINHSKISRALSGYDSCGNVCGVLNHPLPTLTNNTCEKLSVDKRNEPYLLILKATNQTPIIRHCVEKCETFENFKTMNGRCVDTTHIDELSTFSTNQSQIVNFLQFMSRDIRNCLGEFALIAIVTIFISGLIVTLLRFFADIVVWTIFCSSILVGFTMACYLSFKFATVKGGFEVSYGIGTVIATVITIFIAIFIILVRHKIKLVIAMFREAGKAIADVPTILILPITTCSVILITIVLFSFLVIIIESAGHLEVLSVMNLSTGQKQNEVFFTKDLTIEVTRVFNLLAFLWFTLFIFSCQDFLVAGVVSKWFFSRMKSNLSFVLVGSFSSLFRFHLGSVCLGSFVLTVVQIISSLIGSQEGEMRNPLAFICSCFWACIEGFLQAFNKNAYIITSLDGSSFCTAGKRAFHLIANNFLGVITIKSVGDFVLILARLFVVLLSVLIGIELIVNKPGIQYSFFPIICGALLSYLISHCFFSVYEMTIDTIFLCFCEDCEANDGIFRPYFMSRSLMQFIQNSKKILSIEEPPPMKSEVKKMKV